MQTSSQNITLQFNYPKIVDINESIKTITELSFKIRLRALNSLVSVSKNNESISGFRAISFELIEFSNSMERKASHLRGIIHNILVLYTNQKKIIKNIKIIERLGNSHGSGNEFRKSSIVKIISDRNTEHYDSLNKEIQENINNLFKSTREFIKICLQGNSIAILAKIESAYMKENKGIYIKLAEDVESFLRDTTNSLKHISASLGIDIIYEKD